MTQQAPKHAPLYVNGQPIRYDLVPVDYMADGMRLYLEHGIGPGSFMTALLCNDLMGACGRADLQNRAALFAWAQWLYNYAPSGSYGSRENVREWMKSRAAIAKAQGG